MRISEYLAILTTGLRLDGWTITVLRDPAEGEDWADVIIVYRRRAEIRLGARFWNEPPEGQRLTLLHELVHLHLAHMTDAIYKRCEEQIHAKAWKAIQSEIEDREDDIAEDLALALAPMFPVPARAFTRDDL